MTFVSGQKSTEVTEIYVNLIPVQFKNNTNSNWNNLIQEQIGPCGSFVTVNAT